MGSTGSPRSLSDILGDHGLFDEPSHASPLFGGQPPLAHLLGSSPFGDLPGLSDVLTVVIGDATPTRRFSPEKTVENVLMLAADLGKANTSTVDGDVNVNVEIDETGDTIETTVEASGQLTGIRFSFSITHTADKPGSPTASTTPDAKIAPNNSTSATSDFMSRVSKSKLDESIAYLRSNAAHGLAGPYYYIHNLNGMLQTAGLPSGYTQQVVNAASAASISVCASELYIEMEDLVRIMRRLA